MPTNSFLGLVQRRDCLVPTWRGWLVIVLAALLAAFAAVHGIYSFLAVEELVPGGVLVVEGWAPDYAVAAALAEYRRTPYEGLFVSGGPLEQGALLAEYQTYAELSAATLRKLGADPATLHAVPAQAVLKDRTNASAVALKVWLHEHGMASAKVNVVSLGPHARRTRLLYEKAFGPATRVGIIAVEDREFDPKHWWRSSQGFRTVTGETIAYLYARLFFHPR